MTQLDDHKLWASLDPGDMYGKILRFPDQVAEAMAIGQTADLGRLSSGGISAIVVSGLGGSAIGGDLVRSYATGWLDVPMLVVRDYMLPHFVGPSTLVLASSYSGQTEETLSAYEMAVQKKARILVFTTGGALAEMAHRDGHPVVSLPGGLSPRAALAYSFFPMLLALSRLGFLPDQSQPVEETRAHLAARAPLYARSSAQEQNPAKRTAVAWNQHIPLIYGGNTRFDAVALRIKCQVTENAKQLAFANVFPEFNHNELVGFEHSAPLARLLTVCILRDSGDHRRTGFRMAIVRKMIADLGIPVAEMQSSGTGDLARMFSLVQWGDFTSFYLAMLNGVDPTPVAAIDHLKRELAERA